MKKQLLFLGASFLTFGSIAQTARVQAIHNCPDAAAATVDVYLNGTILLDDFNYQEASPYIDAPAGTQITLDVCAPTSIDNSAPIFSKNFTLTSGETYTVVASGGLAESNGTAFDLRAYDGMEASSMMGMISANVIHGSYDAPMVDIYEVQVPAGELVPDFSFGDQSTYVSLPAADFDVQVRTQAGIVAGEFDVNASGLADGAITILASGFLDPANAAGTEPFGLIGVLPDGTVIDFPAKAVTPARLQVIHNCAATDAASVDVWLNDGPSPLLDDFMFRTASPFIDAPAGSNFDVSIALPTSTDTAGALFKQTFLLESNMTYIVIASGTVGSGTYSPATPFSLEVIAMAQETSMDPSEVDVVVWHGATDAPTVDVAETEVGAGTIVDDISYGESQGYLNLAPANYDLAVQSMDGNTTIVTYDADLSAFAGNALTVLASGFLDPGMNNNGAGFGLWVASAAGGALIELPVVNSIEENIWESLEIYPNPTQGNLSINIPNESNENVLIQLVDMQGKVVFELNQDFVPGMNNLSFDLGNLSSGMYSLNIISNNKALNRTISVE